MSSLQIAGEDSNPTGKPIFCYAIRLLDSDVESFYVTSFEQGIEIEGLPEDWDADDPQVFSPAQIGHGQVERMDGIDKVTFDMQVLLSSVQALSRYTLFGAIPKIQVDVIRVMPGPLLAGIPAIYGRDTHTTQSGLIGDFGTEGFLMKARCAPEPFMTGHQVPRWRFTRTCNRVLYGPSCGVNPDDYNLVGNIASMDYQARVMVVTGQYALPHDPDFFRQGVMVHQGTGTRHSIFTSAHTGGDTRIWLHQWFPDMELGDVVTLIAGCRHDLGDCTDKFANQANFGGFPLIPNVNPAIHGATR